MFCLIFVIPKNRKELAVWLTGQGAEKRGGKRGCAVRSVAVTASQKPRSGGEKPDSRSEESEGHKAGTSLSVSPLGSGHRGQLLLIRKPG